MSLLTAFKLRTPLLWVDTPEQERALSLLTTICEQRPLFVFDPFDGLMRWEDGDFKIILVEKINPYDGQPVDIPIKDTAEAFDYVYDLRNAIFVLRMAHKDIEDVLAMFSALFGQYRNAFWANDASRLPMQVVCLVTDAEPPAELAKIFTTATFGLPGDSEISALLTHLDNTVPGGVIGDQDPSVIVRQSRGMSELELIETYFTSHANHGRVDANEVNDLKIARLKEKASLDIIRPSVKLSSVGGLDNAKEVIQRATWIYNNPQRAAEFGLRSLRRTLYIGLPGTGKSYLCEAAAGELGLDLARTGVSQMMNKFIGQSEANIRSMFTQIRALSPIAVWIDELGRDLSGGGSSDIVDAGTTSRVHGTFLTGLQELPDDVFLFAAANDISSLAAEMLRADRFDVIMFVGFPSGDERKQIFSLNLNSTVEYDLDALANATPCFTGAEIKSLIERTKFEVSAKQYRHINTDDILTRVHVVKNRIWLRHRSLVQNMYSRALDEHEWASTAQKNEARDIISGNVPTAGSFVKKTTVLK